MPLLLNDRFLCVLHRFMLVCVPATVPEEWRRYKIVSMHRPGSIGWDLVVPLDFSRCWWRLFLLSPLCSGVVEYLSTGGVDSTHKDFKELRYSDSLTKFNCNGKSSTPNGRITHGFKLKSAYENGLMPYTNYTFDFKVGFTDGTKNDYFHQGGYFVISVFVCQLLVSRITWKQMNRFFWWRVEHDKKEHINERI